MGQAKRRKQQLGALYGTPETSPSRPRIKSRRPASLDLLSSMLSREDQTEVANLLNHGPVNWERSYTPLPAFTATTAAVIVRCIGEAAFVELVPLVDRTTPHDPHPRPEHQQPAGSRRAGPGKGGGALRVFRGLRNSQQENSETLKA